MDCPCQSHREYKECCEPILESKKRAESAEQLMRARYVAYTQANMDFIRQTHDPKTVDQTDMAENKRWAEQAEWKGLKVLDLSGGLPGDKSGTVEFEVDYKLGDKELTHHELSRFVNRDGHWFFHDGETPGVETIVRAAPKVGRNDPCPCGSGKKFKKCCANA